MPRSPARPHFGAVGAGVIGSLAEAAELLPVDRRVEPRRDEAWRGRARTLALKPVAAAADLR